MLMSFFSKGFRHHRRLLHGVPRDLSPQMMRDIGLEPWPERPHISSYPLW